MTSRFIGRDMVLFSLLQEDVLYKRNDRDVPNGYYIICRTAMCLSGVASLGSAHDVNANY